MKLRLFIEGPAAKAEGSEFLRPTKGPLWCEITFAGDGTKGKIEFLFRGDFFISRAGELAERELELVKQLELERSELRAGKTICDGKTVILTSDGESTALEFPPRSSNRQITREFHP